MVEYDVAKQELIVAGHRAADGADDDLVRGDESAHHGDAQARSGAGFAPNISINASFLKVCQRHGPKTRATTKNCWKPTRLPI